MAAAMTQSMDRAIEQAKNVNATTLLLLRKAALAGHPFSMNSRPFHGIGGLLSSNHANWLVSD